MPLFTRSLPTHLTPVVMVGARAGDAVLSVGADDATLIAELGRIAGLNGRAVALDVDAAAAVRVAQAAAKAGALVEFQVSPSVRLAPDLAGQFDVVVVQRRLAPLDPASRRALVADAFGAARPGGRVVLILGTRRTRWLWTSSPTGPVPGEADAHALLRDAGALAVRTLATIEGLTYIEARARGH